MPEPVYKVRALEKLYYIDDLKVPGEKRRNGEPADEFCLLKKEDFNPNLMEPLGWKPETKIAVESLLYKEDGSKRTQVEIANIKSDELDKKIRDAKVEKVVKEEKQFQAEIKPEKPRL